MTKKECVSIILASINQGEKQIYEAKGFYGNICFPLNEQAIFLVRSTYSDPRCFEWKMVVVSKKVLDQNFYTLEFCEKR